MCHYTVVGGSEPARFTDALDGEYVWIQIVWIHMGDTRVVSDTCVVSDSRGGVNFKVHVSD